MPKAANTIEHSDKSDAQSDQYVTKDVKQEDFLDNSPNGLSYGKEEQFQLDDKKADDKNGPEAKNEEDSQANL